MYFYDQIIFLLKVCIIDPYHSEFILLYPRKYTCLINSEIISLIQDLLVYQTGSYATSHKFLQVGKMDSNYSINEYCQVIIALCKCHKENYQDSPIDVQNYLEHFKVFVNFCNRSHVNLSRHIVDSELVHQVLVRTQQMIFYYVSSQHTLSYYSHTYFVIH